MDWKIAQEMAVLSHAVYDDDAPLSDWYDYVRFIEHRATDAEAYLLANDKMRVLVVRGSDSWSDWLSNIFMSIFRRKGRHLGFDKAADGLFAKPEFAEWLYLMDGPIFVTGHSKGGAIGKILTLKMPRVEAMFGFGVPRVGTKRFKREYREKATPTYLFANAWDYVTWLPPRILGYVETTNTSSLDGKGHWMTVYLDEVSKKSSGGI